MDDNSHVLSPSSLLGWSFTDGCPGTTLSKSDTGIQFATSHFHCSADAAISFSHNLFPDVQSERL